MPDPHQPFYLINKSPASSTSTLVLRTLGLDVELHTTEDVASAGLEQDSSIYFATTTPSSPYMRSAPGHSSPPALRPSQGNGTHECPPDSSSPLMASSSSACSYSSPYFPAVPATLALTRSHDGSSGSPGTSTSLSTDDSDSSRDLSACDPDTAMLDESDVSFGAKCEVDNFARRLCERLLVIARERGRGNVKESNRTSARSLDGQSCVSSRFFSGISNSSVCNGNSKVTNGSLGGTDISLLSMERIIPFGQVSDIGLDVEDSSWESELDTPFFASPPLSENITPPRFRKRVRETDNEHATGLSEATEPQLSTQIAEEKENTMNVNQPQYRIIWRAESFRVVRGQQHLDQEEWEKDAPPLKRKKANSYTHLQQFASKPASFRRAASLKSANEFATRSASFDGVGDELVPTEPTTPVPSNLNSEQSFFMYGVPIIAPPPDHVASFPVSEETLAKIRLRRFLEREFTSRQADGLGVPDVCRQEADLVIVRQRDHSGISGSGQKNLWEEFLTVGQHLREDIVDWLLNVLPSGGRSQASSVGSSFSSSTSHNSSSSTCSADLYEELSGSPETRFHAVYVFLRFFYRVMSRESDIEQVMLSDGTTLLKRVGDVDHKKVSAGVDEEGRRLVVWDIAVGSLTLSVKFHRDFLEPLSPVFSREYQQLAPHRLSFGDLESAQRDILTALSYHLGVTPQPLLDNLWLALPSLRQLFDYEGGWNYALRETWLQLFDAIAEPDVLQYPISLLTVACLVEGILAALVQKHDFGLKWRKCVLRTARNLKTVAKARKRQRTVKRIEERVEGVIHDMQAAIGLSDVSTATQQ
ncbi:hypothetical protein AX15_007795 [Amanita polypyramis BW_CC]|nr:hypothetical protein AX15_007795 [Amanita polypyramis BW_CC]